MVSSLARFWACEVRDAGHVQLAQCAIKIDELTSISARSLPAALGYGVALSAGMFAFDFTGGSLFGTSKDKDVDEFDRRTKLRKAFQSPGEQTVAELGEGRGMYPSTSTLCPCNSRVFPPIFI